MTDSLKLAAERAKYEALREMVADMKKIASEKQESDPSALSEGILLACETLEKYMAGADKMQETLCLKDS